MPRPTEAELDAAYDQGYEAADHVWGHKLPPCPYPQGSALANKWYEGLSSNVTRF
jgi:hypothetical protein